MRRQDGKTVMAQWSKLFEPYMDRDMTLSFGTFTFPGVFINSIELAKTTGMTNAPEKRLDENGKRYTPAVILINTNAGVLRFVIEDTTIAVIQQGIRLITASTEVDLRMTHASITGK